MNSETAPFSPIALVGTITLLAAYLVGAWCVAAGIAGNARKSRRLVSSSVYGSYAFTALVSLASALLIYGFVTHDYAIKYIAATSDVSMSIWYKVTAFWGGLDGSLLFWVLVLALFSSIAIVANARKHRDMIGYVVATILAVQVFFLSLLIFHKNPFSTYLTSVPNDGQGLNPLLQNYWMVIHPPSLYIGFVAATIPFAFGIGALASGRLDDLWLGSVRVWMLICFLFLSLGLILGGRWAYEELGWGGYWAWDPVENAGFIPWFTATAFLHSAIIQEQRGGMKQWNMLLVVLTFFFTIFGTFMTRSGIVQSVHAFGEDNVLALQFILFMGLILVVSFGLMVFRQNKLATKTQFESFYSREFAFLVNNWILLACAFFVLFATMFPTISEALDGDRVTVGISFFNKWMTPMGLVLLFLAGAAPLLAWRRTTRERLYAQFLFPTILAAATIVLLLIFFPQVTMRTPILASSLELPMSLVNFGLCAFVLGSIAQEFYRGVIVRRRQTGSDPFTSLVGLTLSKRRKYGGYLVHLGVAVMFVGFGGKAYDRMIDRTLPQTAIRAGLDKGKTEAERVAWATEYLNLHPDTVAALRAGKTPASYENLCDSGCTLSKLIKDPNHSFDFGDYTFVYEDLVDTFDDHKNAITGSMSVWLDGENLGVVYPAKWDYRKGQEATHEVAIKVRAWEDVYVVLTGFQMMEGNEVRLGNFRVFINPLISWVWVGFLLLGFGTLVCLIPQSLVDRMSGRPIKTRLGRAADIGILVVVIGGLLAGLANEARAAGQVEHIRPGMGMGNANESHASKHRPDNAVESAAMKELLCPCGCKREDIFICKCANAADLRAWVKSLVNSTDPETGKPFDLATERGRERAYDHALSEYVKKFGEQTLATPRSSFSWLLPSLAAIGGLGLIFVAGRRFVTRSRAADKGADTTATATPTAADEKYVDKLDDELAETD